jgi:hypothetical protein
VEKKKGPAAQVQESRCFCVTALQYNVHIYRPLMERKAGVEEVEGTETRELPIENKDGRYRVIVSSSRCFNGFIGFECCCWASHSTLNLVRCISFLVSLRICGIHCCFHK